MRRMLALPMWILVCFGAFACKGNPSEPKVGPDMDLTGTWTVIASLAVPHPDTGRDPTEGSCTVEEFRVTVNPGKWKGDTFRHSGFRSGLRRIRPDSPSIRMLDGLMSL